MNPLSELLPNSIGAFCGVCLALKHKSSLNKRIALQAPTGIDFYLCKECDDSRTISENIEKAVQNKTKTSQSL